MNIYEIKQNLLSIFDELEENSGELTPELEKELAISQESLKDKVKDYTNVIKLLEADIENIKVEQKRLKDLADRKKKVVTKLKDTIISAIEEFGDTKKSGVKYIDYSTGVVSIRTTKSVNVDEHWLEEVGIGLSDMAHWYRFNNQLDTIDCFSFDDVRQWLSDTKEDEDGVHGGVNITQEDAENTIINVTFKVPLSDITSGYSFAPLKSAIEHTSTYQISAEASKTKLKPILDNNGSAAPNLAKLEINKSLSIK